MQDIMRSDDDDQTTEDFTSNMIMANLGLSRILSRSRYSLNDDLHNRPSRSPSSQRLGPKNPTFTSHVNNKTKLSSSSSTLNTGIIYLPKEYKPNQLLETLEKKYKFVSGAFHVEQLKKSDEFESFGDRETLLLRKVRNQLICNYAKVISTRRVKELQVLGCLIMEIFLSHHLRAMGNYNSNTSFDKRLQTCILLLNCSEIEMPPCISYVVKLLFRSSQINLNDFAYPAVSDLGLPQPSAHLLLQSSLHCIIPFSRHFPLLYKIIHNLKEFKNVVIELDIFYYIDCDGEMCSEYETLERRKVLFAQNIGECKVKSCAKQVEFLLNEINPNTDNEIVKILLPHIKELLEEPSTSVLSAWYLFEPISKALGPLNTIKYLVDSMLKLYENEPSQLNLPYMGKIAKLYHHSFLLRLMVRFGLKCFLDNFVVPLVEAVGCYKDFDKVDFILHDHSEKILTRASHLKNMNSEQVDVSVSESTCSDESTSNDKLLDEAKLKEQKVTKEEDIFEFDDDKESEEHMRSLIEHLELNIACDLPFNHSTAEEALDATLEENIVHLNDTDERLIVSNSNEDLVIPSSISIPSSYHTVSNISCDIGSRKSENDMFLDKKLETTVNELEDKTTNIPRVKEKKSDITISEMSCDSLVWLSHRLGPVLTAKYLSRNLLKMLTLCYVGGENLKYIPNEHVDSSNISISSKEVIGDQNSAKVLKCLCSIAGKNIRFVYFEFFLIIY